MVASASHNSKPASSCTSSAAYRYSILPAALPLSLRTVPSAADPAIIGLLSAILGNASEVDASKLEKEFSDLLIEGETIQHAYKLFRDLIVFTNYRLFLVDKQGMTGKKREYTCVPYKSIDYFSKETAGHFDLDAEIKIWIKSRKEPIVLEFRKDAHIHDVFKVLSYYALAS
jgi:hypothetical protein